MSKRPLRRNCASKLRLASRARTGLPKASELKPVIAPAGEPAPAIGVEEIIDDRGDLPVLVEGVLIAQGEIVEVRRFHVH